MSKRFRLNLEMSPGSGTFEVGWMEVTSTGRILEVYIEEPVARMSSGPNHNDTRCTWCALDHCMTDLVTPGADACLCCKSNHGEVDPNTVRSKTTTEGEDECGSRD